MNKNIFKYLLTSIVMVTLSIILIFAANTQNKTCTLSESGYFFDTFITITLYDINTSKYDKYSDILKECLVMCNDYEKIFSTTLTDSELYSINHSDNNTFNLSSSLSSVIEKSLYYYDITNGAYDVFLGDTISLWNFKNETIPTPEEISNTLTIRNNTIITFTDKTLQFDNISESRPTLNLGGIAKGYIADMLKEFLVENGVSSAIINLGGNVLMIGSKANGENFNIGIKKPFTESGENIAIISASDYSVVTSGIYERYFTKDNIIYHHLINPLTGKPTDNNLYSVTIISKSSTEADALSTGIFVLGLDAGIDLINSLPDTYAVFCDNENNLVLSDGLTMLEDNTILISK